MDLGDQAGWTTARRSSLEKCVLWYVFRGLLSSDGPKIVTDIDDDSISGAPADAIILRLPNLLRTLQILLKPDVMLGQAYVNGYWSVQPERLYEFLYLIRSQEESSLQKWFVLSNQYHVLRDAFKQRLFPIRATRAVAQHYNSDPDFVSLILGPSLCYTCAFFEDRCWSLEEAQARKLHVIAERISLRPGQTVLELGSGWGYAAFPLGDKYDCDITGISISDVQVEFCNRRTRERCCKGQVRFINADYATYRPEREFNRVISIGMLEHVGKRQYGLFFDRVAEFLREDGVALIHSMIEEQETSPDAWIDRNIFPGGYIPTVSEVTAGIEASKCELIDLFTHPKSHYFRTLEHWKRNLFRTGDQSRQILKEKGLSDVEATSVRRIWEYFLSSSQIAFSEKYGRCRIAHFVVKRKTT